MRVVKKQNIQILKNDTITVFDSNYRAESNHMIVKEIWYVICDMTCVS